jgi:hypothetical protein
MFPAIYNAAADALGGDGMLGSPATGEPIWRVPKQPQP